MLAHATHFWAQTPYLKHNHVGRRKYFLLEEINNLNPDIFSPASMFRHFYYPLTTLAVYFNLSKYLKAHLTHTPLYRVIGSQTPWKADEDVRLPKNGKQDPGER